MRIPPDQRSPYDRRGEPLVETQAHPRLLETKAGHGLRPPPVDPLADDRVLALAAFCEVAGISIATLRRLIKTGDGPRVTWLSARRCGVRVRHGREWLDGRATGAAA